MLRDGIWRKPASAPVGSGGEVGATGLGVPKGEVGTGTAGTAGGAEGLPPATMTLLRPAAAGFWLKGVWIVGCTTIGCPAAGFNPAVGAGAGEALATLKVRLVVMGSFLIVTSF